MDIDIKKIAAANEKKTKIQSICAVIKLIIGIIIALQVLVIVSNGASYVLIFASDTGELLLSLMEISFTSASEKAQAICICVLMLANMALVIVWYVLLWGFFSEIEKKNKPFLPGQGKRLQMIAILMIVSAFLTAAYLTWELALSPEPMHISVLFWSFLTTFVGGIIDPLIFLAMAMIFNHGIGLQTESDETL